MKKYLVLLLTLLLLSCESDKSQGSFINYNCNIPIIECVIGNDTVNLIVDTGAEYSLIDTEYYQNNKDKFRLVNEIETQFSGIGGVNTQISSIVSTNTSFGYITFVEQNLQAVRQQLPSIAGLIGSDFLKAHNFIIDYKTRKIYPYEKIDSIYGKSNN